MSEEKKLNALADQTQTTLIEVSSMFPFTIFPNTIRVDQNKADIIWRQFFTVETVFSMLLSNINGIHISESLFFAALTFEVTGYETNPEPIKYLPKNQARQVRRILLGLITAHKEGIDMSKIPDDVILQKVEEIGASRSA